MCSRTAGSRLKTEKLSATMAPAIWPPLGPVASATREPRFHSMASAAATTGRPLRSSPARRRFIRKKYSSIPKIAAPAQWPMVLTRTGSWILSQSGMGRFSFQLTAKRHAASLLSMFIGGLIGFDLARWARGKHTWPQMSADEIEDAVESVGSEACCSVADRCGEVETIDAYAQSIDANLKKMEAKYFVEAIAQAKTTRRETRRLTQAWSVASLYLNE